MNIKVTGDPDTGFVVNLTLSRRNLLTLLAKLNDKPEGSRAMIFKRENNAMVQIKAIEDSDAYKDHPAGPMVGATEREITRLAELLKAE